MFFAHENKHVYELFLECDNASICTCIRLQFQSHYSIVWLASRIARRARAECVTKGFIDMFLGFTFLPFFDSYITAYNHSIALSYCLFYFFIFITDFASFSSPLPMSWRSSYYVTQTLRSLLPMETDIHGYAETMTTPEGAHVPSTV